MKATVGVQELIALSLITFIVQIVQDGAVLLNATHFLLVLSVHVDKQLNVSGAGNNIRLSNCLGDRI